jgi:hypothetical protein
VATIPSGSFGAKGLQLDLVAMDPPKEDEGQHLFRYFHGEDWIRFLPLLHFLREVSGWELPPPRACFMFDDLNLH